MEKDTIKQLEMRIVELEDQLKALRKAREPEDITAEEIRAYKKVREVLYADWGEMCGINDCDPCVIYRCRIVVPCQLCGARCDVECTCGPCNIGDYGRGSLRRFSSLGR